MVIHLNDGGLSRGPDNANGNIEIDYQVGGKLAPLLYLTRSDVSSLAEAFEKAEEGTTLRTRFVALDNRRKALEVKVDDLKQECAAMNEQLLEEFVDEGVSLVRLDAGTLYLATRFYCSKSPGVATDAVCEALKANGMGSLVRPGYAPSSLTAMMKEMFAEDNVPDDFTGVEDQLPGDNKPTLLNMGEITTVKCRRS